MAETIGDRLYKWPGAGMATRLAAGETVTAGGAWEACCRRTGGLGRRESANAGNTVEKSWG